MASLHRRSGLRGAWPPLRGNVKPKLLTGRKDHKYYMVELHKPRAHVHRHHIRGSDGFGPSALCGSSCWTPYPLHTARCLIVGKTTNLGEWDLIVYCVHGNEAGQTVRSDITGRMARGEVPEPLSSRS